MLSSVVFPDTKITPAIVLTYQHTAPLNACIIKISQIPLQGVFIILVISHVLGVLGLPEVEPLLHHHLLVPLESFTRVEVQSSFLPLSCCGRLHNQLPPEFTLHPMSVTYPLVIMCTESWGCLDARHWGGVIIRGLPGCWLGGGRGGMVSG